MADIELLKRLAEAATPGPWRVNGQQSVRGDRGEYIGRTNWNNGAENAAFIAAANPAAILALIAENERLRKHLAECADSLESEIIDRYGSSKDHPAMRRKFELDMLDVIEARAAMGKGGKADG